MDCAALGLLVLVVPFYQEYSQDINLSAERG